MNIIPVDQVSCTIIERPQEYSWEHYFAAMELYPIDPHARLKLVIEIQNLINLGCLEVAPGIQQKLTLKGYSLVQNEEQIANFKNMYPLEKCQKLQDCVAAANKEHGLLVGLHLDYYREYPLEDEIKDKKRLFEEKSRFFLKIAIKANKLAKTVMDQEWDGVKENMSNLNREQIYFCNRFMKMGLLQFECSMEMKQLLQRFSSVSQNIFQSYKLHRLYDKVNHLLEKGIERLEINSSIWMNDRTAVLKTIDSCTELTMDLNLKIRTAVKLDISIIGLKSLKNSCYMNSTLQMVSNVPELIQNIHTLKNKPFVKELCALINNTRICNTETIENLRSDFFTIMKLNKDQLYGQQDAHEFLNFILDQLNWNPLKMYISIQDNQGIRLSDESASHLQMTIHTDDSTSPLALQEMINRYTQPEDINQCKKEITQIKNSSEYLFLHVVRSGYNTITAKGEKKSNPLIHGLHECLKMGEDKYHVIGWITHIGGTINSGHYTSTIKRDGFWIHYNDDIVQSIAPTSIDEGAYIVLLKKLT